jgi:hypothetical protein
MVEFAMLFAGLILPMSMMVVFTAQMLWVWNSAVDFTREGARYAATHCYQGGTNVISWMAANTPIMFDRQQFRDGQAEIEVTYYGRDADSGELVEYECDGAECTRECVPESVKVRIANYQFGAFLSNLGLAPVQMPDFQTILPIESSGCNPGSEECLP